MMQVYWSTADNDPKVYHLYRGCPEGEQIHPTNLAVGMSAPSFYRLCKTCAAKHSTEVKQVIRGY